MHSVPWSTIAGAALLAALATSACSGRIRQHSAVASGAPEAAGRGAPNGEGGPADEPGARPADDPSAPATPPGNDDESEPPARVCTDLGVVGAPVPLRRLTAAQVERSAADVLGSTRSLAVTDEKLFTYRSNISTPIDSAGARGYLDFAEGAAADADLARCAAASARDSCLSWLLDEVGLRLFRRPLADEERARYTSLYQLGVGADTPSPSDGARWVLQAMLQSPSFTYLDEVSDAEGYLDAYSLAARMALVLWGSNPDDELLARATEGKLATVAEIRVEAERMLADPRSRDGLSDFVDQWLELDKLDDPDSRPDLAALGSETLHALREEPVALFASLLAEGKGLRDLLTTQQTVRLDPLASIYGADILSTSTAAFQLDPARRAGILSLPGVMAALSHAGVTSPTRRGYAVLSSLLCTPPAPPPPGVNVTLPDVGPDATARERLEAHFSDDICGSCHRQMDGIGFAFEGIDWLGKSRDDDHGKAIDDATMFALGGKDVHVEGVAELATAMAGDASVASCVARQWARYATGIPETDDAECLLQQLGSELPDEGGLGAMMIGYLTSDWFRRGAAGGQP
jgi:hypothetical protein